jgi:uncharacterized membrane-anchored protein
MSWWRMRIAVVMALAWLSLISPAAAQQAGSTSQDPKLELRLAVEAAVAARVVGPSKIELAEGVFELPAKFSYVASEPASRLLRAMGNTSGNTMRGLILDEPPFEQGWFITVNYIPSGYIKDDDAKDWNADELLQNLRDGTEESNKDRKTRGINEIEVTGWIEKPQYESATHRLVWSAGVRDKGASATDDLDVNYNTYMLGREGYFSMNLITAQSLIDSQKPMAKMLLAGLDYLPGKRYGDFNASTDRVAEYGLAALVGGVAAKKLGLFALIAAFAAKFAKVIGIAAIAAVGVLFKLFRRKRQAT